MSTGRHSLVCVSSCVCGCLSVCVSLSVDRVWLLLNPRHTLHCAIKRCTSHTRCANMLARWKEKLSYDIFIIDDKNCLWTCSRTVRVPKNSQPTPTRSSRPPVGTYLDMPPSRDIFYLLYDFTYTTYKNLFK